MSNPSKPLAYLVSMYPAVSHTFILREVQRLRALGHRIATASINTPDRAPSAMEGPERQEYEATYYVKAQGVVGALAALLYWLRRSPLGLLRMLRQAAGLGKRGSLLYGLAYGIEAALVARWMEQGQMAHLHVHFGSVGATVGLLVKQLKDVHLSYTIHGPDEFDDVPGQHLALKMESANSVVCISQFARGQLMRISAPEHWAKLRVCRLGVDPDQFHYREPVDHGGALQLLCVGRLTPAKGQVLLVQACARLRERGVRFHLTLVGDGPDRRRIEHEIGLLGLGSQVSLTGALPQAAVRQHFGKADVFVLPSFAEGIPVVLMEAMSSGVPCVSTPVNGIPELIEHDHSGLLAVAGDVDSLTDQLARLAADPALRVRLARAGRQKVRQEFDLDRNVRQLGHFFNHTAGVSA